jgi:hypothetical protein
MLLVEGELIVFVDVGGFELTGGVVDNAISDPGATLVILKIPISVRMELVAKSISPLWLASLYRSR